MNLAKNHETTLLGIFSLATLLTLSACGSQVSGGGTGGSGGHGTTSTAASSGSGGNNVGGGGSAGGSPGGANAIAMLYGELQNPNPTGTTTSSGGGGPDPNTLYIAISDTPEICSDPFQAEPCGNHYRVALGIPVALQKVGIIPLNDPSIIANFSWAGPADATGQCPGGGGSFFDGELEITAIDALHVEGILTNTSTFDFDANGAFTAARCMF